MNTFKKIGLTALASSLVVTSAVAGEMSVTGTASLTVKNNSKTAAGKTFEQGNVLNFTGSGELDNGISVTLAMELDQGDAEGANSPFDNQSVTLSSDALGTMKFSGHGGSSAQTSIDTTAAGDLWNNGFGITDPLSSGTGNNSIFYTLPTIMDGVAVNASYAPGSAGNDTETGYGVTYTGIEGLSVSAATGETGSTTAGADHNSVLASYAFGPVTVSYSNTENDTDAAGGNEDITSYNLAYTLTDDISVTYGTETFETEGSTVDEEVDGVGVSYTTGGMTLSANQYTASGVGNSNTESASTGDMERWKLSASFAF